MRCRFRASAAGTAPELAWVASFCSASSVRQSGMLTDATDDGSEPGLPTCQRMQPIT